MRSAPLKKRGFTYLMLLWWVAIGGVMLAAVAQSWSLASRRERETELVFRGEQIRQAIQSYYDDSPQEPKTLPPSLEALLEDRRGPVVRRHLRRLYKDPITRDGEWGLVKEGALVKGVYSLSPQKPLRGLDRYERYAQWSFDVNVAAASSAPDAASAPDDLPAPMPVKRRGVVNMK